MMCHLGHDCPVEVSSVGRSAYVTQFIDFWDSICTGAKNISCSSFSGDLRLCVPYWKDCLVLVLEMIHTDISGNVTAHAFPSQSSTMELVLLELHFWNGCSLSIAYWKDKNNTN